MKTKLRSFLKFASYIGTFLVLFFVSSTVFAENYQNLGGLARNITSSFNAVAKLITAVSYVAGVAFALMGMLKFKAHKDNPTEVALSQPLVLLAISAGLVYLPSLINTGGQTLWANNAISGSTAGDGLIGIKD